jgi:hypothetical protein
MTRRTTASLLLTGAAALALAACSHQAGSGTATASRSPATAGLAADSAEPSPGATQQDGGGTRTTRPTPSPSRSTTPTGPQIVSVTATGAVCPVYAKPGAPYSQPGQVTISWKLANADGVSLAMDGGLWKSYDGQQGSDTLPFSCPQDATKPVAHTFTVTIKNTHVTKTVSATAKPNP